MILRGQRPSLDDLVAQMADDMLGRTRPETTDAPPLWNALPGPQTLARDSLADELFYGGEAGGGKTDLILGLALTQHLNSVIFRREFSQFRGAQGMIARSREIVGLAGDFTEGRVWRNLPGGRAVEFGSVKLDRDKVKWQGRPHDLKAFDEIPEFTEDIYRFLIGWLRTTTLGQRTRVVCTGNPPTTPEGQWVIKYWGAWLDSTHPRPAKPGELRWYITRGGGDVELMTGDPVWVEEDGRPGRFVKPRSRTFIRAGVRDNPYYMKTGYDAVLDSLPEPLRSQMRFGNFQATNADDPWQVIPTAWILAAQARWKPDGHGGRPLSAVGVDPSRGGKAEFAIAKRHDAWVAPIETHQGVDVDDGVKGSMVVYQAVGGDTFMPIKIDVCGAAGSSVYDQARQLGLSVIAVNGSERSHGTDRAGVLGFVNKRSEIIWKMRELLDPEKGEHMALPPDAQLRSDLASMRWSKVLRGIRVEEKDDIIKRIGRSPDRGEAVIYCCVDASQPARKVVPRATWGAPRRRR